MITNPPKFSCPQEGMYAVGQLACDLATAKMANFQQLSPAYTPALITALRAQIASADAMPGEYNRAGRRRVVKVDLLNAKDTALNEWQVLKGFIIKTWPDPAMQAAKLSTAGASLYGLAAGKSQWANAAKLLQIGDLFISENSRELEQNNVMPDTFAVAYREKLNLFISLWNQYSQTNSNNEAQSNNKRLANNEVYDKIIQICKDGRRIFKGNSSMQKQFAFTQMLGKVGYGGTAGIRVLFTYGPNNLPIADVDAVSTDLKYAAISNGKGLLIINRMTEGTHTFTFSAEGFDDMVATVTLTAGVKSRFEFTMKQEANVVQEDIAKAA